jgi:hypothetical protein
VTNDDTLDTKRRESKKKRESSSPFLKPGIRVFGKIFESSKMKRRCSARKKMPSNEQPNPKDQAKRLFSNLNFIRPDDLEPDFDKMMSHVVKCFAALVVMKKSWKETRDKKGSLFYDTLRLLWELSDRLESDNICLDFRWRDHN